MKERECIGVCPTQDEGEEPILNIWYRDQWQYDYIKTLEKLRKQDHADMVDEKLEGK